MPLSFFQLLEYLLSGRLNDMHSDASDSVLSGAAHDPTSLLTDGRHDDDVRQIGVDRERMRTLVSHTRQLDASGEFFVVPHVMPASQKDSRDPDVALVTHCSLSQLHHLPFLSIRWNAPISLTLFVMPAQLTLSFSVISALRKCHEHVRDHVHFHIVFPAEQADHVAAGSSSSSSSSGIHISEDPVPSECQEAERFVLRLKISSRNYGEQKIAYPNNLLRNIGRRYAGSEFTLVTDIDMVPSAGLRNSFLRFWSDRPPAQKLVFVLPAYEVRDQVADHLIPGTKEQLLVMVQRQEARPFYMEVCWKCQKVTRYAEWEHRQPQHRHHLSIMHTVRWRDPWEPFYISRNDVPLYDERFRRYGFNRISQVCETHVAGYDFAVLDNAFLVHRGWKQSDSFHGEKEVDQEGNRILFRQFKSSLISKYATAGTTRSCG